MIKRINSEAAVGKVKASAALIGLLSAVAFGLWVFFDQRDRRSNGKTIEMPQR